MPEQMPEPSEAPIVMSKELKDAIMALGKPTPPPAARAPDWPGRAAQRLPHRPPVHMMPDSQLPDR